MIKFSNKSLLTLALIMSVCVAGLVYHFLTSVQQQAASTATIVVAKTEILANTVITADMVEEMKISGKLLQPGAISDLGRAIGAYAKETIPAQEQITEGRIMSLASAGFAGTIPRDKRAVSIAVTDVTGVAGLVKPGDYVDVIVIFEPAANANPIANMLVQNVLVLATNKTVDREEKGAAEKGSVTKDKSTLTIAVTPDEAVEIGLAGTKGTLTVALRPFAPADGGRSQVQAKTFDHLRGNASIAARPLENTRQVSFPAQETGIASLLQSLMPPKATSGGGTHTKADYGMMKTISVIKGTTTQDVYIK